MVREARASPKKGLARLLPTGYGDLDADAQYHHYPWPEGAMVTHRILLGRRSGLFPAGVLIFGP